MTRKVVFITGSAKRLGAATAEYLHANNYNVVLHCNTSYQNAEQLTTKLNQQRPDSAHFVQGDITNLDKLVDISNAAVNAFGRIDVLINNASSFFPTHFGSISQLDWNSLVGSNMQAPLFLTQLLRKQLIKNQGVVINMVDIHAQQPLKDHTLYCMAKAGLVTMTKSLAQELAPKVRVNAVAPGAILWPEQPIAEQDKQHILDQIPLARLGSEKDIAKAIRFLIEADYITGQILNVDGGRSISNPSKA